MVPANANYTYIFTIDRAGATINSAIEDGGPLVGCGNPTDFVGTPTSLTLECQRLENNACPFPYDNPPNCFGNLVFGEEWLFTNGFNFPCTTAECTATARLRVLDVDGCPYYDSGDVTQTATNVNL